MKQIKKYELKRRTYVPVKNGARRSYGGRQQWFSKEVNEFKDLKAYFTHTNGCGVIALCDLFLYLAFTRPDGKETQAGQMLDAHRNIMKDQYMVFVEKVRDEYAMIYGGCGTFGWELCQAVNKYAANNDLSIKAKFEAGLSELETLKKMREMLSRNYPIILMIGQTHPVIFSQLKKKGIPFFKQTKVNYTGKEAYGAYEIAEKNVYGHFVVVTGILIDEHASWESQRIMLRVSSWGEEYYISYEHYCYFMRKISRPWLCGIITIEESKK